MVDLEMNRYILARATINPFMVKLAKMFKSRGARVESISIYEPAPEYKEAFHKCHFLMKREDKIKQKSKKGMASTYIIIAKNIKKVIKPLKNCDMVIGVSEPNAFVYFIFLFAKCKKIFYPYDIAYLRYKKYRRNKWYDFLFEKRNFKKADAIIHKYPEDSIKNLPFLKDKPTLQFLPYADKEKMERENDKLEGTHIVYVGVVYDGIEHVGTFPLKYIFKVIANAGIHIHIYPVNYKDVANDKEILLLQQSEYFHLHKPVYGDQFRKELSQYHWGLYMLHFDKDLFKDEWKQSVFGNKVADYVEAGLPVLCNKSLPFVCEIVEKYNLGLSVDHYSEIPSFLSTINYGGIQKNLYLNRHLFCMEHHNHKLIDFLEGVCNE